MCRLDVDEVTALGTRRLARAITRLENGSAELPEVLRELGLSPSRAHCRPELGDWIGSTSQDENFTFTVGAGGITKLRIDYDGDGYLDVFLLNGGAVPGKDGPRSFYPALYRNQHDGTFKDVTREAGIQAIRRP